MAAMPNNKETISSEMLFLCYARRSGSDPSCGCCVGGMARHVLFRLLKGISCPGFILELVWLECKFLQQVYFDAALNRSIFLPSFLELVYIRRRRWCWLK